MAEEIQVYEGVYYRDIASSMSIGGEYHLVFVGSSGPWLFLASSKNGKPTDVLGLAARIQGKELQFRYGDGIPKNQILVTVSAYDQQ